MAGLFGLFGGGGDRGGRQPAYSMEQLQQLHSRLQSVKDKGDGTPSEREQMVKVIREITEALIWDEQNGGNDNQFFDFFCEKTILADFVGVMGLPVVPKTVKVQLLQTLSMLVQNIRRPTSLYYLFSNNYVNQLISTQLDWSDEDILGYYISFLKSLALKLNEETVKFFFNEKSQQFPLYIEAVRFFGHREQMVRTAVRTLTLTVYRIEDTNMRRFVLERSSHTYFVHLACYLRELWTQMQKAAQRSEQALADVHQDHIDLLLYIKDILTEEMPNLGEALAERLLEYAMLPVLVGSLVEDGLPEALGGAEASSGAGAAARLRPACALFVLHQVFCCCHSAALLPPLAGALLQSAHGPQTARCRVFRLPEPPATYRATNADVSGPPSTEGTPPEGARPPGSALGPPMPQPGDPADSASADGSGPLPRDRLLALLRQPQDFTVSLVIGLLQALVDLRHEAWAGGVLAQAGLLPPPGSGLPGRARGADAGAPDHGGCLSALGGYPRGRGPAEAQARTEEPGGAAPAAGPEVLLLAAQALESHASLRMVTVQTLARFLSDLAAEWAARCKGTEWRAAPLAAVCRAERSAALQTRDHLRGPLRERFLDLFPEAWAKAARSVEVADTCGNIRCLLAPDLLPSSALPRKFDADWVLPQSEGQQAAKAAASLLVCRRLRLQMLRPPPPAPTTPASGSGARPAAPSGDAAEERSPMHVAEEALDGYREGQTFELDRLDRIVCGVVTPHGRHTRYFVLHKYVLLLVQPDLCSPGKVSIRTLVPLRCVTLEAPSADPRTLRLGVWLPRGSAKPGEASAADEDEPSDTSEARRALLLVAAEEQREKQTLFILTLSFEDVKRTKQAIDHLQNRRNDVRAQLLERISIFVEGLCT